jgi:hypothetical protein
MPAVLHRAAADVLDHRGHELGFLVRGDRSGLACRAEDEDPGRAAGDQVVDHAPHGGHIDRAIGRERGDHRRDNAAVLVAGLIAHVVLMSPSGKDPGFVQFEVHARPRARGDDVNQAIGGLSRYAVAERIVELVAALRFDQLLMRQVSPSSSDSATKQPLSVIAGGLLACLFWKSLAKKSRPLANRRMHGR